MTDLLTTIHFLAFIGFGSLALASRSSVFKFEFSNIRRILYYTSSRVLVLDRMDIHPLSLVMKLDTSLIIIMLNIT